MSLKNFMSLSCATHSILCDGKKLLSFWAGGRRKSIGGRGLQNQIMTNVFAHGLSSGLLKVKQKNTYQAEPSYNISTM